MNEVQAGGAEGPAEVSLEEALKVAVTLHRSGMLDDAEAVYTRILQAVPDNPDALNLMGLLVRQRGQSEQALALLERAVAAAPGFAAAHNNLANLLCEAGHFQEAAEHLLRTLEIEPDDPRALNNLGNIARIGGQVEEAIRCFERALEIAPEFPLPHENLGRLYVEKGDIPRAHDYFCKAVALDNDLSHSKQFVGMALCQLERYEEAREYYLKWIAAEPSNPVPKHLLSTVAEGATPTRASDEYVRVTFDSFAKTFDVHLQRLQYRAPALVVNALKTAVGLDASELTVLDAGCGTGLCGELLRPVAKRLDGVDLSSGMLARARDTGRYDELAEDELGRFMNAHPERYDAIACADTLCYFGDLSEAMRAAKVALRSGGCFVFTVEEETADPSANYRIHSSGRYAHTERYVREAVESAGLGIARLDHAWLRMEIGQEVGGLVVAAVRP